MKELISRSISKGVSSSLYYEFNGETYTYSIDFYMISFPNSSCTEIILGSSEEPPIEFIDSMINSLKKTKLHMLKNKWEGNVSINNPVRG